MKQEIITLIEENQKAGNFLKVKKIYEEFFSNMEFDRFLDYQDEYFDVVCRILNINLEENNSIFIKLNEEYGTMQGKISRGESLSEHEANLNKLMIYSSSYVIHWGKYENQKLEDIVKEDVKYVLWCIINLAHFSIENTFFLNEDVQNDSLYKDALELNLVKHLVLHEWYDNIEEDEESSCYSWLDDYDDDVSFNVAFEGDEDAWEHYNQ